MHAHIAAYALVMLRMACVVIAFASWGSARAHGGGLDANGCHTNRKTGEYHCHRGPSVAPRKKPLPTTPVRLILHHRSNRSSNAYFGIAPKRVRPVPRRYVAVTRVTDRTSIATTTALVANEVVGWCAPMTSVVAEAAPTGDATPAPPLH